MANMSYCRFENTYKDLLDCYNALTCDGMDSLSNSERKYAERMKQLCQEFTEIEDEEIERNEEGDEYVVGCASCGNDVNDVDDNGNCKSCK